MPSLWFPFYLLLVLFHTFYYILVLSFTYFRVFKTFYVVVWVFYFTCSLVCYMVDYHFTTFAPKIPVTMLCTFGAKISWFLNFWVFLFFLRFFPTAVFMFEGERWDLKVMREILMETHKRVCAYIVYLWRENISEKSERALENWDRDLENWEWDN